jgi:hypothetical protein
VGPHGALFGEDGARYVILVPVSKLAAAQERLSAAETPWRVAGRLTADGAIRFQGVGERSREELQGRWDATIEERMESMQEER